MAGKTGKGEMVCVGEVMYRGWDLGREVQMSLYLKPSVMGHHAAVAVTSHHWAAESRDRRSQRAIPG